MVLAGAMEAVKATETALWVTVTEVAVLVAMAAALVPYTPRSYAPLVAVATSSAARVASQPDGQHLHVADRRRRRDAAGQRSPTCGSAV